MNLTFFPFITTPLLGSATKTLSDGQRLCSAQQNQPQRSVSSRGVPTVDTLRLVSDTAAVQHHALKIRMTM